MKTPLLRKLTQPQPHATCVSATLRSSASARSHHNYNHPNRGPPIKRKRSNHYQQVSPPTPALPAPPCRPPSSPSIPSSACELLRCSPKSRPSGVGHAWLDCTRNAGCQEGLPRCSAALPAEGNGATWEHFMSELLFVPLALKDICYSSSVTYKQSCSASWWQVPKSPNSSGH